MRRSSTLSTIAIAAVTLAGLPVAASAATITHETVGTDRFQWNGDPTPEVVTISAPDATTVQFDGSSAITIDASALAACSGNGTTTVTCDLTVLPALTAIQVNTDDGVDTLTFDATLDLVQATITSLGGDGGFADDTISNNSSIPMTGAGSTGDDTITGGPGNDTLDGDANDDRINGRGGNDVISNSGGGADILVYSGAPAGATVDLAGDTAADGRGGTDTVTGSFANVIGTPHADSFSGDGSNTTFLGGAGVDSYVTTNGDGLSFDDPAVTIGADLNLENGVISNDGFGNAESIPANTATRVVGSLRGDTIVGSNVADTLLGGDGEDYMLGGPGVDTLNGGNDVDSLFFSSSTGPIDVSLEDSVAANDGLGANDTIISFENVVGSSYADTIEGNSGTNFLDGGPGVDVLSGGGGFDAVDASRATNGARIVIGGAVADDGFGSVESLVGSGIENVLGSSHDDVIVGNATANTILGGDGDDVISGNGGVDTLLGGSGTDTVSYDSAPAGVDVTLDGAVTDDGFGNTESLTSAGFESVTGSAHADTIVGTIAANVLDGGAGNDDITALDGADTLIGGAGTDSFDGGPGADTISFAGASAGATATIGASILDDGAGNTETLVGASIEHATGSAHDDSLTGDSSANTITGGDGADTIDGGTGADDLDGGAGNDTLLARDAVADVVLACAAGASDVIRTDLGLDPTPTGCESVNADLVTPPGDTSPGGTTPSVTTPTTDPTPPVVTPPTPTTPRDRIKPTLTRFVAPNTTRTNLLRFGLPFTFTVSEGSTVTGSLVYRRFVFPTGKPKYVANTTIGTVTKRVTKAGKVRLVVKLTSGGKYVLAKRERSFKLVAQVKAVDAAKNVRVSSRAFDVLVPSPKVDAEM